MQRYRYLATQDADKGQMFPHVPTQIVNAHLTSEACAKVLGILADSPTLLLLQSWDPLFRELRDTSHLWEVSL